MKHLMIGLFSITIFNTQAAEVIRCASNLKLQKYATEVLIKEMPNGHFISISQNGEIIEKSDNLKLRSYPQGDKDYSNVEGEWQVSLSNDGHAEVSTRSGSQLDQTLDPVERLLECDNI